MGKQESMKLPQIISDLEKENGQLKNELEKEKRVTVLLQGNLFCVFFFFTRLALSIMVNIRGGRITRHD